MTSNPTYCDIYQSNNFVTTQNNDLSKEIQDIEDEIDESSAEFKDQNSEESYDYVGGAIVKSLAELDRITSILQKK